MHDEPQRLDVKAHMARMPDGELRLREAIARATRNDPKTSRAVVDYIVAKCFEPGFEFLLTSVTTTTANVDRQIMKRSATMDPIKSPGAYWMASMLKLFTVAGVPLRRGEIERERRHG